MGRDLKAANTFVISYGCARIRKKPTDDDSAAPMDTVLPVLTKLVTGCQAVELRKLADQSTL
jgi:hypothetical protein